MKNAHDRLLINVNAAPADKKQDKTGHFPEKGL